MATTTPDESGAGPHITLPRTTITEQVQGDRSVILTVAGALDWSTTSRLVTAMQKSVNARSVTVDLSGLVWADSALLHALINTQRHLRSHDTPLVLRGPLHPVLARLFDVTGTRSYFVFHDA
ncbi:STAS domain-containing protein [Streptomyces sp. NPDC048111]|uniref:STAS domain-containing protein n=1 Tax=Streptomyces sp. NPDC048111 TaxID=3365500 RepID=UPI003717E28A